MESETDFIYLCYCPFENCQQLVSMVEQCDLETKKQVSCPKCGQLHEQNELSVVNAINFSPSELASLTCLQSAVQKIQAGRKLSIYCQIDGVSPFLCNLLSHLFTYYDINPETSKIQRMVEIDDSPEMFDVSAKLCKSAFLLFYGKLAKRKGYGSDGPASNYLMPTLENIAHATATSTDLLEVLEVHGHGSCLYQALSKVLTGYEIYWHALQENLVKHFEQFRYIYAAKYPELNENDAWHKILLQCDLETMQQDNVYGMKLHIQGLSDLLRRPIILLDRLKYMKITQTHIVLFLPLLNPSMCRYEEVGQMNSPIIIGWANEKHQSFVPVVSYGMEAVFTNSILPVWNGDNDRKSRYIEFNKTNLQCKVSTGIPPQKLQRKISLMWETFKELYNIDPKLVCDYCEDIWKVAVFPNNSIRAILNECIWRASHAQLWRCMVCRRLSVLNPQDDKLLIEGGFFYDYFTSAGSKLQSGILYSIPPIGKFIYCDKTDKLIPTFVMLRKCDWCKFDSRKMIGSSQFRWNRPIPNEQDDPFATGQNMRLQAVDRVLYVNGDHTETVQNYISSCKYNRLHWFDGREYVNMPFQLQLTVPWKDSTVSSKVILPFQESNYVWWTSWSCYREQEVKKIIEKFPKAKVGNAGDASFEEKNKKLITLIDNKLLEAYRDLEAFATFACRNPVDSCRFPFAMLPGDIYEDRYKCTSDKMDQIRYSSRVERIKKHFNDYYSIFIESSLGSAVKKMTMKEVVMELPQYSNKDKPKTFEVCTLPNWVSYDGKMEIGKSPTTIDWLLSTIGDSIKLLEIIGIIDSNGVTYCRPLDLKTVLAIDWVTPIVILLTNADSPAIRQEPAQMVSNYLIDRLLDLAGGHFSKPMDLWPYLFNCPPLFAEGGVFASFFDHCLSTGKDDVHFMIPGLTAKQVLVRNKARGILICIGQLAHIKIDPACRDQLKDALEKAASSNRLEPIRVDWTAQMGKMIFVIDDNDCAVK